MISSLIQLNPDARLLLYLGRNRYSHQGKLMVSPDNTCSMVQGVDE
jgi:hypothetical protein